jgi:hypothetical protein
MNPAIEAAWIAGGSGLLGVVVGVTGTVIVAKAGFRSTRDATDATTAAGLASIRAQIEADRRNRIWEKQAAANTDAIAGIVHRQRIRQGLMRQVLTVDWTELGARLIAYASPAVVEGLEASASAGRNYESAVAMWNISSEQARTAAEIGRPVSAPAGRREAMDKALAEADRLDDTLMDTIRAELHAGTDRPPAPPLPLARPAADHPE